MMHNAAERTMKLSMACLVGLSAALGGAGGCDDVGQTDQQIRSDVQLAMQTAEPSARIELLEGAAGQGDASSAAKAQARAALAQANLDAANDLLKKLGHADIQFARLMWQTAQLNGQIQNANTLASGYRQYDPAETSAQIASKIKEARGGADQQAWFTHDDARIPTLAAVTQDISRLTGEITNLQARIDQLTTQRAAALDEAEQSARQAETLEGKPGVDAYRNGADLRKQAADLSIDIDRTEAALMPLRNELAVAEGQRDIVNGAIAQFEQQQKQLEETWAALQQQAEAQTAAAQQIVSGGGAATTQPADVAAFTLEGKLQELNDAQQAAADLRAQAQTRLDAAVKFYEDAGTEAGNIAGDLRELQQAGKVKDSPAVVAVTMLRDVYNPGTFKLQQAHSQYLLGTLHAGHASLLSSRNQLNQDIATALQAASLAVPDGATDQDLDPKIQEARALADTSFTEADRLFLEVLESQASEPEKDSAKIGRIFNLYAWSQAAEAAGEAEAAQQRLADATAAQQQAQSDGIPMPAMPAALGAGGAGAGAGSAGAAATDPAALANAAADQFADAISKGDADAAKALVASDDQAATVDAILPIAGSFQTLSEAIEAKFEQAGSQALLGLPNIVAAIRDGEINVQGEAAQLTHSNLPQPLALKVVNGVWKIDLSGLNPQFLATLQAFAPVAEQIAIDVNSGRYATVEDLAQAVREAAGTGAPQ